MTAPSTKPESRIIRGYRIRQDVLDHLDPIYRQWAYTLIREGIWILVPAEEAGDHD